MSNAPQTLTESESDLLLEFLLSERGTHKQNQKGHRNYCIALLMLDAGLRVGEVSKLHVDDLYFGTMVVRTIVVSKRIAKNHVERIVPASIRIRRAIELMEKFWWSQPEQDNNVFAFYGTNWNSRITTRQIQRIIHRASLASIGRAIHPHVLRHTFATRLMRTVDARIVQELLGHKDLTTTQIYMHPNHDDLSKAIETLAVSKPVKSL